MRGFAVAIGFVALAVAACGTSSDPGTSVPPTVSAATPADVVTEWVDSLGADSVPDAGLVDDLRLAIILAVENGFDVNQTATVVTGGLTDSLRISWWRSFADEFSAFADVGFTDIEVGGVETFTVGEETFAAVAIDRGEEGRVTEVILRRAETGAWLIDMVATVGPTLVRPLRAVYVSLAGDEDDLAVRIAYRSAAGSLLAARQRPVLNEALPETFLIEVDALADLLRLD